nr:cytochrome c oxidase subunit III [Fasciola gigantica]BDB04188.1 cytochrome c oxidase subunit III [Fasciola gigantica]BDB04224.1 cytochrome c oxidase subunit III [Fasciola gigantica]BDB04236.1 cytochrome c oxidase subunit III [Fasciola gigantica]BDB04248.1 cytochrome c oxidase subunit III [Fasciola gigantica]
MSWLPIYNAWVLMIGIVSVFLWKLVGLWVFLFVVFISLVWLIKESLCTVKHYATAFWVFILSEVIVFGTLFCLCVITVEDDLSPLSSPLELPLLGCFILTGSSVTVTTYHHYLGSYYGRSFLLLTIILGFGFLVLQMFEFYDCECDFTFCVYGSVCFSTVGLHFLHVFGGLIALCFLYFFGDVVPSSNVDFVVWYWHFVDYIWLFVYLIIYLS